jgi:hypothetical protein
MSTRHQNHSSTAIHYTDSICSLSETDASFINSFELSVSPEDSAHSCELADIEDAEVRPLLYDADADICALRGNKKEPLRRKRRLLSRKTTEEEQGVGGAAEGDWRSRNTTEFVEDTIGRTVEKAKGGEGALMTSPRSDGRLMPAS